MNKNTAILIVVAAAIVAFLVGRMTTQGGGNKVAGPEAVGAPDAPKQDASPFHGPANAKVTIYEISDFQCPFCSRASATVKQLMTDYGDNLKVVFVHQPLPFHPNAKPAAIASMAAHRQGKFWEMHDKLFGNASSLTPDNYEKWALEIGLNVEQFKKDVADPALEKKVLRDQAAAVALGARGTPAFFINGTNLSGAQPIEKFKEAVDAALKAADEELGKGTKLDALEEKLTLAANAQNGANLIKWLKKGEEPPAQPAPGPEGEKKARPQEDDKTVYKAEIRKDAAIKGPANALVTIVEVSDFQCPFCSKVRPTLRQIAETYGDKVRFVFNHQPLSFHKDAMPAALAAEAAREQGKFWEMEDKLFTNQQALTAENFKKWAREIGCDGDKFDKAFDTQKHKARIEADSALATSISASGTPAFFINGRKVGGAQPFENFKKIIDQELAKAEALVKGGAKLEDVYAKTIANGKKVEPPEPLGKETFSFDLAGSPLIGDAKSPVTIVTFEDFQCPFCARVGPTLKQVEKELKGKVKVAFKHYPLSNQCNPALNRDMHPAACAGAVWGIAATEQGKFWEFADKVFENMANLMPKEGDEAAKKAGLDANLERFAKEAGVDIAKAKAFVDAKKGDEKLKKDLEEATKAKVGGTPSIFINGRQYNDNPTPDAIKKVVEGLLSAKK